MLEFEAEMHAASQVPDPRPVETAPDVQLLEVPRPPRPLVDRSGNQQAKDIKGDLAPPFATHGAPILDWNRGDFNEALASLYAMMAGIATSILVDTREEEFRDDKQVLWFLQMHKYGSGPSAQSRD